MPDPDSTATYVHIGQEFVPLLYSLLSYTGDMPQDQENAGSKTQRAELGCPFYFTKGPERDNLEFNVKRSDRYHHQAIAVRKEKNFMKEHDMAESVPLAKFLWLSYLINQTLLEVVAWLAVLAVVSSG